MWIGRSRCLGGGPFGHFNCGVGIVGCGYSHNDVGIVSLSFFCMIVARLLLLCRVLHFFGYWPFHYSPICCPCSNWQLPSWPSVSTIPAKATNPQPESQTLRALCGPFVWPCLQQLQLCQIWQRPPPHNVSLALMRSILILIWGEDDALIEQPLQRRPKAGRRRQNIMILVRYQLFQLLLVLDHWIACGE